MKSDTRERLLVVMRELQKPVCMNDIISAVENETGTRPDRKSVYIDLRAIEKFYPLNVERVRSVTWYSMLR